MLIFATEIHGKITNKVLIFPCASVAIKKMLACEAIIRWCALFVSVLVYPDKINKSTGPAMLFRVAHVTVAREQPVDDNAIILAVNPGATFNCIGVFQWAGYVLQA